MSELSRRFGDRPWWLHDVPQLLAAVTRRIALAEGTTLLIAVDLEQRVLGVTRLPKRKATYERRTELAYDVMAPALERALPERPWGSGPTGSAYLIRARSGRVVPLPEDAEWERSLLYATGYICCYDGGLVLVTPHGWRYADTAGPLPNLSSLGNARLRPVKSA